MLAFIIRITYKTTAHTVYKTLPIILYSFLYFYFPFLIICHSSVFRYAAILLIFTSASVTINLRFQIPNKAYFIEKLPILYYNLRRTLP